MFGFLLVIHVLICIALTIVILMQSSKGGGLSGVFGGGGGSAGAFFGGRTVASFLHKVTIGLASGFLLLCLLLGSQIFKDQRAAYDESLTQKARSERKVSSSSAQIPTVPGAFDEQSIEGKEAPAEGEASEVEKPNQDSEKEQ